MNSEANAAVRVSRKRFSLEEINEVLKLYEKSSLTQKQFAVEQGISVATLINWRRRRRELSTPLSNGLLEVVEKDRVTGVCYRIEFARGYTLVLEEGWRETTLRELLRILGSL